MKKIVITVPDQVKMVTRSKFNIYTKYYNITEDLIIKMFSPTVEYHEDVFFEDTKSILVESIEDVN